MPSRNTPVLKEIIEALGGLLPAPADALARLEAHFKDRLLIVAGDVKTVADAAEKLRLFITTPEYSTVLDHIAHGNHVGVTIDHVEDAINALFEDRFIEPKH